MVNRSAPKKRHFSMLRSFVAADFLTLSNAASGMGAIFCALRYLELGEESYLWGAFILLPLALIFDLFDGFVARWRRSSSILGADLDSLADIVSFGVAPAILAYVLGMRGGWDLIILIYFVACGVARLARYNATALELSQGREKVAYYEGTPIPTSLILVLILGIAFSMGKVGPDLWWGTLELGPWEFHPLTMLYGLSGSAMISATLRIPKP